MKRFWWGSVVLLLCLMYFTTSGAVPIICNHGSSSALGDAKSEYDVLDTKTNECSKVIDITIFGQASPAQSVFIQRKGGHIHLRPTAAAPKALTLYEQARANLVAR